MATPIIPSSRSNATDAKRNPQRGMTASALPDESRSRDRAIPGSSPHGRIPYTLGPRVSFWVAAAVVAHALWTSSAPAMTYPSTGRSGI
jgi:hypothetical protein